MVNINVSILNRLKIRGFLQMQSKYIKHSVILNKTVTNFFTILTKCFFPYLNLTSYLKQQNLRLVTQKIEAATRGVLWKNVFLEISQNSQESTCARVYFLAKLTAASSVSVTIFYCYVCSLQTFKICCQLSFTKALHLECRKCCNKSGDFSLLS